MKKLSLIFFAGLLFCCSKNETTETAPINQKETAKTSFSARLTGSPNYGNNPWDFCGERHNKILQAVVANKANLNKDADLYIDYSLSQFHQLYDPSNSVVTLTGSEIRTVMADSTNFYINVIEHSNHSAAAKSKLTDLITILKSAVDENNLTYAILKDRIINFEDTIINSNLSQIDKDAVLKVSSIARHSAFFWKNELGNMQYTPVAQGRRWWKWLTVAVCDVAGGVAGAVAGAPTGVAAVAGAVAGAAGASAGAVALVEWISPEPPKD